MKKHVLLAIPVVLAVVYLALVNWFSTIEWQKVVSATKEAMAYFQENPEVAPLVTFIFSMVEGSFKILRNMPGLGPIGRIFGGILLFVLLVVAVLIERSTKRVNHNNHPHP